MRELPAQMKIVLDPNRGERAFYSDFGVEATLDPRATRIADHEIRELRRRDRLEYRGPIRPGARSHEPRVRLEHRPDRRRIPGAHAVEQTLHHRQCCRLVLFY